MMQVIIPFTLWWWKDLSQEVARDKSFLAQVFKLWRFVATGMFCVHEATHLSFQHSFPAIQCESYDASALLFKGLTGSLSDSGCIWKAT